MCCSSFIIHLLTLLFLSYLLIIESKTSYYAILYSAIFDESVFCFYHSIFTLNAILKQIAEIICSKLAIETLEQGVKYVQSYQ